MSQNENPPQSNSGPDSPRAFPVTRERKLLVVLAGLAVVAAAGMVAVVVTWPPFQPVRPPLNPGGVTPEDFQRIEKGMSRREVETILGGPPGNYATVGVKERLRGSRQAISKDRWIGNRAAIDVWFSGDRVVLMHMNETYRDPAPPD
jgi:hypothetical protein